MENLNTDIITKEIIISIIIVAVAVAVYFLAKKIVNRVMEKSKRTTKKEKHI